MVCSKVSMDSPKYSEERKRDFETESGGLFWLFNRSAILKFRGFPIQKASKGY